MATPRPLICLDCRARVAEGEACECRHDRRVDVTQHPGRKSLIEEVWGSPSTRRQLRDAKRAGATGAGVGGIGSIGDCFDCSTGSSSSAGSGCGTGSSSGSALGADALGEAFVIVAVIAVAACAFIALYFLITWIARKVREYRNRPRPHGALYKLPPILGSGVHGRVSASALVPNGVTSPSGFSCLAWTSELRHQRVVSEGAMLRDASTAGFDVTLDDGRVVHVPEGRLRIDAHMTRVSKDGSDFRSYVAELDPLEKVTVDEQEENVTLSPFPFDSAHEVWLVEGDRVELIGPLTLRADASLATDYRQAAGALVPEGVPVLRKTAAA